MVKTCNWLERDGVELSLERATKDLFNTFASHLKTCGLTERLLDTESPHRILTVLFPQCAEASAIRKMRAKLNDVVARLEKLQQLTACRCPRKRLHVVRETNPRIVDGVLKDMILGRIAGFYFLDGSLNDDSNGHVVLMREVRHIPRSIAETLANGMEYRSIRDNTTFFAAARNVPDVTSGEDLLTIAQLQSPYVEHLMQNFSMLFARIGVPDIEPRHVTELLDKHRNEGLSS